MVIKQALVVLVMSLGTICGQVYGADDLMKQYGVEKQIIDTNNTRTDIYRKELGKTDSGHGYGGYYQSRKTYDGYGGERDTSAHEIPDGRSSGVGVYIDY